MDTPLLTQSPWPNQPAKSLFERQRRAPRDADGIITAFRDGEVTLRSNRRTQGFTNAIHEHGYQGVRRGDLVIHSMDGFAGAIGVSDSDGKSSPVVHCYRPGDNVDPRFYAYLLRDLARADFVTSLAKGIRERSTAFDSETFRSLVLPVPTFEEQRAIADYLDTETARIDALITKKRRMIELLEQRDQRVVDDLFGRRTNEPHVRLGYFADVRTGIAISASRPASDSDILLPYLRVANVQHGRVDLTLVKQVSVPRAMARRSLLAAGDVLMTEGGDIDKLGRGTVWHGEIEPCVHQNHVFAVRTNRTRLSPEYLALVTRSTDARVYFETTGVQSTNLASTSSTKVANFVIPFPDLNLQRKRVAKYEESERVLSGLSDRLSYQLDLLAERRQALITAAVTGELEIPGAAA